MKVQVRVISVFNNQRGREPDQSEGKLVPPGWEAGLVQATSLQVVFTYEYIHRRLSQLWLSCETEDNTAIKDDGGPLY